jgi:hypothetical protein
MRRDAGIKKGDLSGDKVALNVTTGGPGEVRLGRTTTSQKANLPRVVLPQQ